MNEEKFLDVIRDLLLELYDDKNNPPNYVIDQVSDLILDRRKELKINNIK